MCTWRQDCKEKKALPNLIYEITIFVKVKITTRIKNHERNWHANRESQKVKLNIISAKRIRQEFMKNVDLNCQTKDNGSTFPRSLLPKACVNSFFFLLDFQIPGKIYQWNICVRKKNILKSRHQMRQCFLKSFSLLTSLVEHIFSSED